MANNNDVSVRITGDASSLQRATVVARGSLAKLQGSLSELEGLSTKAFSFSGLAGIGLSATAAAAAVVGATKAAADYGDQLDNMSKRTGVAVEELARLQYAAKMSDTSSEALGKGLSNLSKLMVSAAEGAKESGALFEKFGISLRKEDGSMRSTIDVLSDLADIFFVMPDGAEKSALAAEFFGKKIGSELIPLLNEGRAGIKALGDEAERLGLVLSAGQAASAAEFNDNLDRMAALAKAAQISIGNSLIPSINEYIKKLNSANSAGLGFFERLSIGLSEAALVGNGSPEQSISKIKDEIELAQKALGELARQKSAVLSSDSSGGIAKTVESSAIDSEIKSKERSIDSAKRRLAYYESQASEIEGVDEKSAQRREIIADRSVKVIAELEKLRGIAVGKVSADILKTDKERTDEQIKNAEKLRAALQSAWESSRRDAEAAGEEAKKLFEKAAGVRSSAADRAQEIRDSGLSDAERASANYGRAQDAMSQGSYYASAAAAAKLDGRSSDFEKYVKQAESFLDRAMRFAEKAGDANTIEDIGKKQGSLLEQQAGAKQAESAGLQERAAAQAAQIKSLDADIEKLKVKAASVELTLKTQSALGELAGFLQELNKIPASKEVTILVKTIKDAIAGESTGSSSSSTRGFASGGWTGPGGKYQPAGIVHAEEFVNRREVVRQPGALAFLERFNRIGMAALKGYASGGLVTSMSMPSFSGSSPSFQSSGTPLVLDFGKLGRFSAEAPGDTAKDIERIFKRAALGFGKR